MSEPSTPSSSSPTTGQPGDLLARRSALISDCGAYRYDLRREWDDTLPLALFVMLNPSTADATEDDPTIRRCVGFARSWGCGGVVVANVFALRATDPKALLAAADPIGPDNDTHLKRLLHDGRVECAVAAWGASFPKSYAWRVRNVRHYMEHRRGFCLGQTVSGQPRHPLYLKADTPLERLR